MSKLCKPPFRKFKHSIQPMMKHKSFLSVKMFPKFLINSVCDSELRFKLIAIYNWLSQLKFYRTNWWDFRNHKTETFKAAVLYVVHNTSSSKSSKKNENMLFFSRYVNKTFNFDNMPHLFAKYSLWKLKGEKDWDILSYPNLLGIPFIFYWSRSLRFWALSWRQ